MDGKDESKAGKLKIRKVCTVKLLAEFLVTIPRELWEMPVIIALETDQEKRYYKNLTNQGVRS